MDEDLEKLTGDPKNFVILKEKGLIPRHIKDYGEWISWKKRRETGEPEPPPPPGPSPSDIVLPIFVGIFVLACVFAVVTNLALLLPIGLLTLALALAHYFLKRLLTPKPPAPTYLADYRVAEALVALRPFPTPEEFWDETRKELSQELHAKKLILALSMEDEFKKAAIAFYEMNILHIYDLPPCEPGRAVSIREHRDWLEMSVASVRSVRRIVVQFLLSYSIALPAYCFDTKGTTVGFVRVVDVIDAKRLVAVWIGTAFSESANYYRIFNQLQYRLNLNRYAYSHDKLGKAAEGEHGKRINAENFQGTADELMRVYLKDTPFIDLLNALALYTIRHDTRFEHVHIVAPSGHGKTHGILEKMLSEDLTAGYGLVVMSPNDELLEQIARVEGVQSRLTFIDPKEEPSLGVFDIPLDGDKETVTLALNEVSDFCQELLGDELSSTMGALVNPLVQLLAYREGSTLTDFLDAITDPTRFIDEAVAAPSRVKQRLKEQQAEKQFGAITKNAIKSRFDNLLFRSPHFEGMFTARQNKVDVLAHLNESRILLINTNDRYGKAQASLLGRYFISRFLQAVLYRPTRGAPPAFLYMDEGWMYLNENVGNLLRQARKYNIGVTIAEPDLHSNQEIQHILEGVAVMIGAQVPAAKMQMGANPNPALVRSMTSRPPYAADFALWDRHRVPNPVKLSVPMMALKQHKSISPGAYQDFRRANGALLAASPSPPKAPRTGDVPKAKPKGQEW